ncbi:MAG: choice-of-anchor D domain-containing protein [Bacteroidetes bacterium]|nr:MAG: choice-of-anchor D domain-containing protein [Bacteroidota bacterium]
MKVLYSFIFTCLLIAASTSRMQAQCEYAYGYIATYSYSANGESNPKAVKAGDVMSVEAEMYLRGADFPKTSEFPVQLSTDGTKTWTTVTTAELLKSDYNGKEFYGVLTAKFTVPSDFGTVDQCYIRISEAVKSGGITGTKTCIYTSKDAWKYNGPFAIKVECTPPVIVAVPKDVKACEGDIVNLQFSMADAKGLTVLWYRNGEAFAKTAVPTLQIPSASKSGHDGTWYATITNSCDKQVTSPKFTITVQQPADITANPESKAVCESKSATLSVKATGTALTYQWYHNNKAIAGATAATYTVNSATISDDGKYHVVVSGACGKPVTSSTAVLAVAAKPQFASPLAGGLFCPGSTTTLQANAVGATLSYQWYKESQPISGATGSSLTLANLQDGDKGFYWVHVIVPGSVLTECPAEASSNRAYVGVYGPPVISTQPQSADVCAGTPGISLHVNAEGSDLHYKWFKDGNPINNSDNYELKINNTTKQNSGVYTVEVTGTCGFTVTSSQAVLNVLDMPAIPITPADQVADVGASVTFDLGQTTGSQIVWMHNDQVVQRSTNTRFTIPSVNLSHDGFYRVTISNVCGSVTTRAFRLTVIDPASSVPTIALSSPSLNMGRVPFGYSREVTFDALVRNGGNVPITINGFNFSGPNAADFTVTAPVSNTLNKGESLTVKIKFTPGSVGASTATLNIQSTATAGTSSIAISGSGVVLYSADRTLPFGTVDKGEVRVKCFSISNPTAADITIDNVTVDGTNVSEFTITTALPLTVQAGSSAEVCAEFKPLNPGNYTANLLITSAEGGNSAVAASGTCEIAASVTDAYSAGMSAYPNPATGTVTINTGSTATTVMIVDAQGNIVTTLHPTTQQVQWNLTSATGSSVSSGLYNIVITTPEGSYFMKLNVIR